MRPVDLNTLPGFAAREAAASAWLSQSRVWYCATAALVFALNVALVNSIFFPNLRDITGFAEAAYINDGRKLFYGEPTPFGYSPLSSALYALSYIPVQGSPYWLIYSCGIGRTVLFGLLWSSAFLAGSALTDFAPAWVIGGFLAFSPALPHLLAQGSHALFAAMSAFALWQTLLFLRGREPRHLVAASIFVGLSVLSRSGEGLILWTIFILFALWLDRSSRRLALTAARSILPCALLLAGYMLFYYVQAGRLDLGMAEYSYFTFEQGHGLAYQSQYSEKENFYVDGQMDARRLFGTPEENHYSILSAIRRNPSAYLQRIPRLARLVPGYFLNEYGGGLGLMILLLALRGGVELVRKHQYAILTLLVLWSCYAAVYLVLVFQPAHFLFFYYVVFILAAIGLVAAVANFESVAERRVWCAALFSLLLVGLAARHALLISTAIFFLLACAGVAMVMVRYRNLASIHVVGILLLMAAFATQARFPKSKFQKNGLAEDEKATLFLKAHLRPGSAVGAYAPINVWMADRDFIPMFRSALPRFNSGTDVLNWVRENHLKAIYVDPLLKRMEPSVWALVHEQIGHGLKVGFRSDRGEFQVLLPTIGTGAGNYLERPWFSSKERFLRESKPE